MSRPSTAAQRGLARTVGHQQARRAAGSSGSGIERVLASDVPQHEFEAAAVVQRHFAAVHLHAHRGEVLRRRWLRRKRATRLLLPTPKSPPSMHTLRAVAVSGFASASRGSGRIGGPLRQCSSPPSAAPARRRGELQRLRRQPGLHQVVAQPLARAPQRRVHRLVAAGVVVAVDRGLHLGNPVARRAPARVAQTFAMATSAAVVRTGPAGREGPRVVRPVLRPGAQLGARCRGPRRWRQVGVVHTGDAGNPSPPAGGAPRQSTPGRAAQRQRRWRHPLTTTPGGASRRRAQVPPRSRGPATGRAETEAHRRLAPGGRGARETSGGGGVGDHCAAQDDLPARDVPDRGQQVTRVARIALAQGLHRGLPTLRPRPRHAAQTSVEQQGSSRPAAEARTRRSAPGPSPGCTAARSRAPGSSVAAKAAPASAAPACRPCSGLSSSACSRSSACP